MKILKLHIALCSILFTTQTITAQHNILMVTNEGSVNAANILSVNYATFNANDKWFTITNDGIDGVKTNSITAICTFGLSSTDVKGLSLTPQVGICYSKDNAIPTINDNYLSLGHGSFI